MHFITSFYAYDSLYLTFSTEYLSLKTDIETKRFIFKNKCIPVKNNYDQISS